MIDTTTHQPRPGGRLSGLRSRLTDERSGRVVYLSHCLLNENTRYLGGAYRAGAVPEVVSSYLGEGVGICQLPCPEQLAWGGVLKRRLLAMYGRRWLRPVIRPTLPVVATYTRLRYWLLARVVARQITDYQRSGFDVLGVVAVDASPTCGGTIAVDLRTSADAVVRCPLHSIDRRYINTTVVDGSATPGRGLFIAALDAALARRRRRVRLLVHDLRSEAPGSALPSGPIPAGFLGRASCASPCDASTTDDAPSACERRRLRASCTPLALPRTRRAVGSEDRTIT